MLKRDNRIKKKQEKIKIEYIYIIATISYCSYILSLFSPAFSLFCYPFSQCLLFITLTLNVPGTNTNMYAQSISTGRCKACLLHASRIRIRIDHTSTIYLVQSRTTQPPSRGARICNWAHTLAQSSILYLYLYILLYFFANPA